MSEPAVSQKPEVLTAELWEKTAREALKMYDWSEREMVAINDFILTCNNVAAERLDAALRGPSSGATASCGR
jgi:hypothetical protein